MSLKMQQKQDNYDIEIEMITIQDTGIPLPKIPYTAPKKKAVKSNKKRDKLIVKLFKQMKKAPRSKKFKKLTS